MGLKKFVAKHLNFNAEAPQFVTWANALKLTPEQLEDQLQLVEA